MQRVGVVKTITHLSVNPFIFVIIRRRTMMETMLCINDFNFYGIKRQTVQGANGSRNTAAVLMFVSLI